MAAPRLYETMYILRPDLNEEAVDTVIDKYRTFLIDQGATDLAIQHRGKRRLAYEIRRFREGIYVQMNYGHANGSHIAPMERSMRIGEEVIRYLTIKLDARKVAKPEAEEAVA